MARFGYNRGAQLLRELRDALKLSQRQLAPLVSMTPGQLASLETGERGPSLLTSVTIEAFAFARGADIPPRAWCAPAAPAAEVAA